MGMIWWVGRLIKFYGKIHMKQLLKKYWLIMIVVLLAMMLPLVVYMWKFGFVVSSDHVRWSEMGSAMSGIYAPILSLLTLVVLGYQVFLQKKFSYLENDIRQTEEAQKEIAYYLDHIKTELGDSSLNHPDVITLFAYSPLDSSLQLSDIAKKINLDNPSISAAWINCNTYFRGLQAENRYPYSTTLVTLKNKAICILSYKECAALDAYIWHLSDGSLKLPYLFHKYSGEQSEE
jgi:hypothetical protein